MTVRAGRCLLPERLRAAGKIPKDLVNDLGYTDAQVSKWVHNEVTMSFETGISISRYLHCEPEELYTWEPVLPGERRSTRGRKKVK